MANDPGAGSSAPAGADGGRIPRRRSARDRDRGRGDATADATAATAARRLGALGSTRIGGFGVDRDVIDVGRREGRFEKIGLEAREAGLRRRASWSSSATTRCSRSTCASSFGEGERTQPLDLRRPRPAIKRIEIAARAGHGFRRRAVLNVYGEKGRDRDEAWELLGQQSVGFGVDRDVIRVGRREGRFEKIALEVKDNDVEILDLKVFFNRGPPQDLRVREFIRAGGRTRPIDLVGGDRSSIASSSSTARGRLPRPRRSRCSACRPTRRPPPTADRGDRRRAAAAGRSSAAARPASCPTSDTIRVGRREGRFSAIQLRVTGNKVHILNLRVVYERGPPDDIQVRSEIRDGGETRPLDLRGERRAIDRRSSSSISRSRTSRARRRVCVFGRPLSAGDIAETTKSPACERGSFHVSLSWLRRGRRGAGAAARPLGPAGVVVPVRAASSRRMARRSGGVAGVASAGRCAEASGLGGRRVSTASLALS